MLKRSRKPKHQRNADRLAYIIDQHTTAEVNDFKNEGKNPAAVALGRLGGKKGGKARAKALTPERRREIARKAAAARWGKDDR